MQSRAGFIRELYELLNKDAISLETPLINALIYDIANVHLENPKEISTGFEFYHGEDHRLLTFSVPKLSLQELYKLLNFLDIKKEAYITGEPLIINITHAYQYILPAIKQKYDIWKAINSSEIHRYRIQSKPILESAAIKTMKEKISQALRILISPHLRENNKHIRITINRLMILEAKLTNLEEYPSLYHDIINYEEKIKQCMKYREVNNNNTLLTNQLRHLIEGIQMFAKHHRFEAIIASKNLFKEVEDFVCNPQYRISTRSCNVIEDVLLELSTAQLGVKGSAKFHPGQDRSRLVFDLTDIDTENTNKILSFLKAQGDETAMEGKGYRAYAHSIPESFVERAMVPQRYSIKEAGPKIERHSIECDAKIFYERVFPLIKQNIVYLEITHPEQMEKYRVESKQIYTLYEQKQKLKLKPQAILGLFAADSVDHNPHSQEVHPVGVINKI